MKDLTGMTFGYLKVLARSEDNKRWKCQCSCGTIKDILGSNLKCNGTKSCGCKSIEMRCSVTKKYNKYDLNGEYGIGYTSNTNEPFYFDLEDFDKIKDYCWRKDKRYGYFVTRKPDGGRIMLHCMIMGEKFIDHIDSVNSKHDNRKSNLRKCTNQQNQSNRFEPSNNTSGHKGVVKHNNSGNLYWRACVVKKPKQHTKSYSIKKYGNDIAYRLACEWVENKSMELYGEFSPYYKGRDIKEEIQ